MGFECAPDTEDVQTLYADYGRLQRDHRELVGRGENYGDFDSRGKVDYLQEMDKVMTRWEEFFVAASRAGIVPSAVFVASSRAYLQRAGLTPNGFRDLIRQVHCAMRQDTERFV